MKTGNLMFIMAVAVIAAMVVLGGCKKKEQPTQQTPTTEQMKQTAAQAMEVEQTVCPVTGEKIDKNVFVEYKGKKVYFCMESCKKAFEQDPEKYIAKLPQFKQ